MSRTGWQVYRAVFVMIAWERRFSDLHLIALTQNFASFLAALGQVIVDPDHQSFKKNPKPWTGRCQDHGDKIAHDRRLILRYQKLTTFTCKCHFYNGAHSDKKTSGDIRKTQDLS